MTIRPLIRRAGSVVAVAVLALSSESASVIQRPEDFDRNGRNSRRFFLGGLTVRDYPRPGASRAVVGAEIVETTKTEWLPEYRLRVGDIVVRIGDVPVRGAIHFARVWDEMSSIVPTPVQVRRRGTTVVLPLKAAPTADLPPLQVDSLLALGHDMFASQHFDADLQELTPSLQECLNQSGGALVTAVEAVGPGAYAGLRAGDILVRINGRAVTDPDAAHAIVGKQPGTLSATVLRQGKEVDLMPFEPVAARKAAVRRAPRVVFPGSDRWVDLLALMANDFRGGVVVQEVWAGWRGATHGLAVRDVITSVSGVPVTSAAMFRRLIQETVRPSTIHLAVTGPTGSRTIDIALPARRLLDEARRRNRSIGAWFEARPDGGVWINPMWGPGAKALQDGDRIVAVAGEPALSVAQVDRLVAEWPANQPLTMEIMRGESTQAVVIVPQAVEDESNCFDCRLDWSELRERDVEMIDMSPALGAVFGVERGVFVTDVRHGSRAEQRGLRGCDVITRIDGEDLPNPLDEGISLAWWLRNQVAPASDKEERSLWVDLKPLTVVRDRKPLVIK